MEKTVKAGEIITRLQYHGSSVYPEPCLRLAYDIPADAWDVFRQIAGTLEPGFCINANNHKLYRELLHYTFGQGTLNTGKALGLMGNTGSGKTLAITILGEFVRYYGIMYRRGERIVPFAFRIFSARRIAGEFADSGYDGIFPYIHYNNICIDDLGSEPQEVAHYGNKLNVIEHIIEERYLARKITHFTTNLNPDQIEQLYGQRVRSRIVHTTNLIPFVDDDWREKS